MDDLAPEILVSISEPTRPLEGLLTLRNVSHHWRAITDQHCASTTFVLACRHFDAFDDALLPIRIQRIPSVSACRFNLEKAHTCLTHPKSPCKP